MKFFASLVFLGLAIVASSIYLDQGSHQKSLIDAQYKEGFKYGFPLLTIRQADSGTSSTLTVKWVGMYGTWRIQQLSEISGFQIRYRAEDDCRYRKGGGIVPYKGRDHHYSARISGLPAGKVYFVMIEVLKRHPDFPEETYLLFRTSGIRAIAQ